jgi:hypothetical protein
MNSDQSSRSSTTFDLVSTLDELCNACQTEKFLRAAASREWSMENHEGPMLAAHAKSVQDVVEIAKQLVAGQ